MEKELSKLFESLSKNERKILPYLQEKNLVEICKKSNLDKISVIRSLEYLRNKGIVDLLIEKKKIIDFGLNGLLYKKKGLPERRLLNLLGERKILKFQDAKKYGKLSEEEFKASLGVLKKKDFIEIKKGKIILNANNEEISKKFIEELFIESIPIELNSLSEEQKKILSVIEKRKNIIYIEEKKIIIPTITELGKKISEKNMNQENMIEQITPEILKKDSRWKGKKFRRYDVAFPVSKINGGKRHIVNQSIDYAKKIWVEMGFKEMTGNFCVESFWNFDTLFTAQDHPVREMHDTFFIDKKNEINEKEILKKVKQSHEIGISGSSGWGYSWNEEKAKKIVLRTHTTCLSSKKLSEINIKELPEKFFSIGKAFRNETVDWCHGFEFNQTEGIVIDKNANLRHLFGYLKQFFEKMGLEKIRFRPGYFPYTEPSVEVDVWNPEKKMWFEVGAAGIFRPEVVVPLLGENIPVLAWGPGFDRIIMEYYRIKDLRELYKNNLNFLRKNKFWIK